jgi:hypothetical protein
MGSLQVAHNARHVGDFGLEHVSKIGRLVGVVAQDLSPSRAC